MANLKNKTLFITGASRGIGKAIGLRAAHAILVKDSKVCTGNFFIDEEVLKADGVTDFSKYRVNSEKPLASDIFLD